MRKFIIVFSVCLVFSPLVVHSAEPGWQTTVVDDSGDVGKWTSIAVDAEELPHISYFDQTNNNLKYAHYSGDSWRIEPVDTVGVVGKYSSIGLDSSDRPHIAYYDGTYDDLMYAYNDGTAWDITVVADAGDMGSYCSLAIDSYDRPHIAYHAAGTANNLKYAYYYGFAWYTIVVDSPGNVGRWTSVALDDFDNPHISYQDFSNVNNCNLKYAYFDGDTWDVDVVDAAGNVGYHTSIAIDSYNRPHISYRDDTNMDLKYAWYDGENWHINVVDSAGDVGKFTSIALDIADNPRISYYGAPDLEYAFWNGVTWEFKSFDTGDVGKFTSIDLGEHGFPHMSYRDEINDSLKYTWFGYPLSIDLVSFTASAEVGGVVLDWSVEVTEGETITGFNLYRRELCASQPNTLDGDGLSTGLGWCKVNDSLIVGANPYSYTDGEVEWGVSYEYRLEVVVGGGCEALGTASVTTGMPTSFVITSIYPNPAVDEVNISLYLPESGVIRLELYDLSGRKVMERAVGELGEGEQVTVVDTSGLQSGVYTVRVVFAGGDLGSVTDVSKLVVVR